MKYFLPTLLALAFCSNLFAQNLQLGWGYTNGSTGTDGANDLVVDAAGNTYVTGYFSGTVDFDKGPGTANLSVPLGQTAKDAFVLKLDAQGNYVWAIRIGGTNNADQVGSKIALDTAGNVVVSGIFNGNLSLPPNATNYNASLTEVGSFMVKTDTAGTVLWGRAWAHATNEIRIEDFVIDSLNFIVAVGEFTGTVNFSTIATPNFKTSAGGKDFFVFKSGSAGHVQLVETGGNANDEYVRHVLSNTNSYWLSGYFKGTLDVNFGSATNNLISNNGSSDNFILKLNLGLAYMDAFALGGSDNGDVSLDLVSDTEQHVYNVGVFKGANVDFDPNPLQSVLFSAAPNNQRGFIQKFDRNFNLIWARAFTQNPGGATTTIWSTRRLAVMANGDLNVIIQFSGTVDVDPDPINIVPLTAPHQFDNCHALLTLDSNGVYKDAQIVSSGVIWDGISKLVNHNSHLYYSGTFYDSIQPFMSGSTTTITSAGLDDMMVVKLLSCNSSTVNTTATACGSYTLSNGQVITQSGTYADTLQTAAGCDSVLSINLTISPLPSTTLVWQGTTLHVQNTSPANTHQWLDCTSGQAIAGATGSSYTPSANGSFAVVVSNGTCADTSACETLSNFNIEESASTALIIYPNPTTGKLNITSSEKIEKIEVFDLLGREVLTVKEPSSEIDLSILQTGVYVIRLQTKKGIAVRKVLKR